MPPRRTDSPYRGVKRSETAPKAPARNRIALEWFGRAIIGLSFMLMLTWTWRGWNDPLIDYGQTLYVAWRLFEGDVLYRDVAYLFGPKSAYFNAAVFMVAGPGLMQLVIVNLVVLLGIIALMYELLRTACGRASAVVGCLVFVLVFGFGQLTRIANYNFVTPYTPEVAHGLALSLAAMWLLLRRRNVVTVTPMVFAGVCWGLVLLTKPEIAVALTLAVAVFFGVDLATRSRRTLSLQALARFLAGAAVGPVAFLLGFWVQTSLNGAVQAILGAWLPALNPELTGLSFYQRSAGFDDVSGNALSMLRWTGIVALVFGPALVLSWAMRKRSDGRLGLRTLIAAITGIAYFAIIAWLWQSGWTDAARALPMIALVTVVGCALRLMREARRGDPSELSIMRLVLAVFALAMLLKVLLRARLHQYGFVLAMPAMMLLVALLVDGTPRWIDRRGGCGRVFRCAAMGLLAAVVCRLVTVTLSVHQLKTHDVGAGADAFRADDRGGMIAEACAMIEQRLPADATVVVMPEGVMLNYLTRRPNPTPYISFLPSDVTAHGESAMLQSLQHSSPDAVVLVHRDTSELGARFFGRDYGRELFEWAREHYEPDALIGQPPLVNDEPGVLLMKRNTVP